MHVHPRNVGVAQRSLRFLEAGTRAKLDPREVPQSCPTDAQTEIPRLRPVSPSETFMKTEAVKGLGHDGDTGKHEEREERESEGEDDEMQEKKGKVMRTAKARTTRKEK